jgi:peptidoglycan/xylan/chitin deacetylase (PgdA/CDA1 family)
MQQNLYFLLHFFYFEINRYHDEFYWIKTHLLIKKLFSRYIWDFPNTEKKVYLTFDDGPTQKLQNGFGKLDQHSAKATFFCIGKISKHTHLF